MIQTQPPQPSTPRNAYEIRQYLKQLSRDMGAVYREFQQHTNLLMTLQIQAYAELEQIEARQLERFDWPAQPQARVSPVSMPLAQHPQIRHLHAGQPPSNTGRMRFAQDAEEPTLPDPHPWSDGGRRTNG